MHTIMKCREIELERGYESIDRFMPSSIILQIVFSNLWVDHYLLWLLPCLSIQDKK